MISHEHAKKLLTSPPRVMGSVVDAATSHYFSAFTLLHVTSCSFPALSCPVSIALWYTMRCITQTMRSKYEIRRLSASIIIDSSTFWLSSRCHLKYLQSVPALYAVWLCSALCPRHKYEHFTCMIDGWYGWLDGWTNVQPKHSASIAAFSSFPAWYNCECYVVGCSSSWKWMFLCVRTGSFLTALISVGIGISPIYQLIHPAAHQHTLLIQRTKSTAQI